MGGFISERYAMKQTTISKKFQKQLLFIVAVALIASTWIIFLYNTRINARSYETLIQSTLADIEKDIEETSNINMLELTLNTKKRVIPLLRSVPDDKASKINASLNAIAEGNSLSEINIVSQEGIILYSNKDEFIGFDMNASPDAQAFDVLNHGEESVVQPVRKNAYLGEGSYDRFNKYAGVPLEDTGYIQIAISAQQFQQQIDEKVDYIAANRHIGQSGYVIISNPQDRIISNANPAVLGDEAPESLSDVGLTIDKGDGLGKAFTGRINKEYCLCISRLVEGYYITGVIPVREVQAFRNRTAASGILSESIIFVLLFLFINSMINSVIVSKIHNINSSLNRIIGGEMDTKVEEYSTLEFAQLSGDINSTVKSLKDYMDHEQEMIRKELEFAKSVQLSVLPKPDSLAPYSSRFSLHATMNAARAVGGDFYDFYMLDESRLAVLIADVSGKGIPAAMFMMTCKTMLENYVESGLPLDEAFNRANEKFCDSNDTGMFVTVWMGILNLNTGHLQYINAGHNPPLFFDDKGDFAYLRCRSGFVLTGIPGLEYKIQETQLRHGDKLFLYTDGVTEANNPNGELYGEERLLASLNAAKENNVQDILSAVKADLDGFVKDAEQFDDITMLGVCFL